MDINFAERVRIKKRIQKADRRIRKTNGNDHEALVIERLFKHLKELEEAPPSPMNSGETTPAVPPTE